MLRFGVDSIGVDMLTSFVIAFCYFLPECPNNFLCVLHSLNNFTLNIYVVPIEMMKCHIRPL